MNKLTKKLILLGVAASLGTTMVACGDKAEEKEDVVLEEVEEQAEGTEEHTHTVPFEWMAKMKFDKGGKYTIKVNKNEGDQTANIGFLRADADIDEPDHHGAHMMDHESKKEHVHFGETLKAKHEYAYEIDMGGEAGELTLEIEEGEYYVFFEHLPEEFDLEIIDADGNVIEATDVETFEEGDEV